MPARIFGRVWWRGRRARLLVGVRPKQGPVLSDAFLWACRPDPRSRSPVSPHRTSRRHPASYSNPRWSPTLVFQTPPNSLPLTPCPRPPQGCPDPTLRTATGKGRPLGARVLSPTTSSGHTGVTVQENSSEIRDGDGPRTPTPMSTVRGPEGVPCVAGRVSSRTPVTGLDPLL